MKNRRNKVKEAKVNRCSELVDKEINETITEAEKIELKYLIKWIKVYCKNKI